MEMLKPLVTVAILTAAVVAAAEPAKEPPPTWPWPGPTPPEIREALIKKRNGILPTGQDLKKIEAAAPDKPAAAPAKPRKVLCWGRLWRHPCNAFTEETVKILGRKTGAFEVVAGDDPRLLLPESLKQFDALFLNGLHDPQPFLPLDWKTLPPEELAAAKRLDAAIKQGILDFVAKDGKGLAGIEGSLCALRDWKEYGELMGASYNGHYVGKFVIKVEDPAHPLTACFGGEPLRIYDQAYVPGPPYSRKNLRVLLSLDLTRTPDPTADPKMAWLKAAVERLEASTGRKRDYPISWVKSHGRGRVKTFSDYRAMYDKIPKEIDLVLIATPDHQHACPSMMAIKLGKHVYCEKPLVHHIAEARALGEAARGAKVATQMGNQGSGTGGHQTLAEWLAAGAIGKLREVHAWHIFASRFGGSMPKPEPQPVPRGLDWDAWLGPARQRPFSSVYRPWHGWCDFGTGSLGGWGTHVMDAACYALELAYPQSVELLDVGDTSEDRFPRWSTVRYDFPQRGDKPPVRVFWHEGSKPNTDGSYKGPDGKPTKTRPHHPPIYAEIERLDKQLAQRLRGAADVYVGEKGIICCGSHGGGPVLLPASRRAEFSPPPRTRPRPSGGIMGDFLRACRAGGKPTFSGFATFAGPFMEMLLVGHLAMRAGLNNVVQWDGATMKCTNGPELNRYVDREYRKGWSL